MGNVQEETNYEVVISDESNVSVHFVCTASQTSGTATSADLFLNAIFVCEFTGKFMIMIKQYCTCQ